MPDIRIRVVGAANFIPIHTEMAIMAFLLNYWYAIMAISARFGTNPGINLPEEWDCSCTRRTPRWWARSESLGLEIGRRGRASCSRRTRRCLLRLGLGSPSFGISFLHKQFNNHDHSSHWNKAGAILTFMTKSWNSCSFDDWQNDGGRKSVADIHSHTHLEGGEKKDSLD